MCILCLKIILDGSIQAFGISITVTFLIIVFVLSFFVFAKPVSYN